MLLVARFHPVRTAQKKGQNYISKLWSQAEPKHLGNNCCKETVQVRSSMKEGAGHRPKLGNPNLENTILNVPSIIMIMLKCLTMITNHRCDSRILLNKYDISTFTMHIFIYAANISCTHTYIYMHMYTDICRWVCVSMYVCLFVCLYVFLSVRLSVCL
jgi:hypothetical protein